MCGRYANSRHDGDLLRDFAVASVVDPPPPPVLERRADRQRPGRARAAGRRRARPAAAYLALGPRPVLGEGPADRQQAVNARSETITEKSAFKAAAARRRCLVPADGYYEWMATAEGKTPIYLHGDGVLGFAGLYELRPDLEDPDRWLWTYTILTCTTQDALGHIHDRSPVVVPADLRSAWLDPTHDRPGDRTRPVGVGAVTAAVDLRGLDRGQLRPQQRPSSSSNRCRERRSVRIMTSHGR